MSWCDMRYGNQDIFKLKFKFEFNQLRMIVKCMHFQAGEALGALGSVESLELLQV